MTQRFYVLLDVVFSKRINPVSQIGILFEEIKPLTCTLQLIGVEFDVVAVLNSFFFLVGKGGDASYTVAPERGCGGLQ